MKISIRWTLILGFLGLIWLTHVMTMTSAYITSQEVLKKHARDIMENVADLAMQQTYNHLNHAHSATLLTRRLIAADIIHDRGDTVHALERYFYNNMAISPQFAGIFLGLPNGNFYDVRRHAGKDGAVYRTKIISHANGIRQTLLIWRDGDFKVISKETDHGDDYDPRRRPWYTKATQEKDIVWTDPYIFFSSKKPGITTAGPSYNRAGQLIGVIGVDIEIDMLSKFISSLRIGKNGRAFMLNRNGDVVAHPDLDKLKYQEAGEGRPIRLVKIGELDDTVGRKAVETASLINPESGNIELTRSRFAQFESNGQAYLTMFTPFTTWQWPWLICVYLPEDDYIGAIKANRRLNIILTLVISCVATVAGLFMTRGIIRPMSLLSKASSHIKNNHFDSIPPIGSRYREIQATADSFALMKDAVQSSQEKYRGIFENIQDVYYEATLDGDILEISPSVEKVYGLERALLMGCSMATRFATNEQLQRLTSELLTAGKAHDFEVELKREHRDSIFGSINCVLKRSPDGSPERMIGSLRNTTLRKAAERELENHRHHLEDQVRLRTAALETLNTDLLREIKQRESTETALREAHELLELRVAERTLELTHTNRLLTEKIGEQKKAEKELTRAYEQLKTTQTQLVQSAKLASIGELASGVAHELNQPLMVIRANAQMIEKDMGENRMDTDRLVRKMDLLVRNTKRMMTIIDHLRRFSRHSSADLVLLDVNTSLRDTLLMISQQLRLRRITLKQQLDPELGKIRGDAIQLEQVFLNLLINARDAIEQKWRMMPSNAGGTMAGIGVIEIVTRSSKTVDDAVEILIKDNGCGIAEEHFAKVFDPFFTTKKIGQGTGLGLSISYHIVKDHEGHIEILKTGIEGTTLKITLPAAADI